ncbi:HNH endonuclease [Belnapia rosea]|uniref:HNH endonuclease n=1 Tax=Belnapia rosea TaxID=938405 RepID=A0A1G7DGX6_9PROT|nr:HNH endonuclease signature motif containing protein [Belnapia rosea]SDE50316.1 HNH endonuclease [Belnapia rosea]
MPVDPYYRTREWRHLREQVLQRDPICTCPGCYQPSFAADHIVERSRGGGDDLANLRGLCLVHHAQRSHGAEPHLKGCDAAGTPLDPMHWWHDPTAAMPKDSSERMGLDRRPHPSRIRPADEPDFELF